VDELGDKRAVRVVVVTEGFSGEAHQPVSVHPMTVMVEHLRDSPEMGTADVALSN